MEEQKTNLILRVLAFIVGTAFLLGAILSIFLSSLGMWAGLVLGPLFIYYSFVGNQGLQKSKRLSSYGNKIK